VLPDPADMRALVVGVEDYRRLGEGHNVKGAAAAAVAVANWLVHTRQVAMTSVDLWLAPPAGSSVDQLCAEAGLERVAHHEFNWADFEERMESPQGPFKDGRLLMVYFCGHGAITNEDNAHYLLLPEATLQQFKCINLDKWGRFFKSRNWAQFSHQLWVVDACRNDWGRDIEPKDVSWTVAQPGEIRRCIFHSCSDGGTAIAKGAGPRFTLEWLSMLRDDPSRPWPDFEKTFDAVAALLRETAIGRQRPAVVIENWQGVRRLEPGRTEPQLQDLLQQIPWDFKQFLPYIMRAQSLAPPGFAPPMNLANALEQLGKLGQVDGIEPIIDFAARVAAARQDHSLRQWVVRLLSPHQVAVLDERHRSGPAQVRLSLWHRTDGDQTVIDAALEVVDAGGGVQPWPRMKSKPAAPGQEAVVMGEWVQAVYDHLGLHNFILEVEIYLASNLLAQSNFDVALVRMKDGSTVEFGKDLSVIMRCADRYKGGFKLQQLREVAPAILARHGKSKEQLRWVLPTDDKNTLVQLFTANAKKSPVWAGFDFASPGATELFEAALAAGLPAALWLRAQPAASNNVPAAMLTALLKHDLVQLPSELKALRRNAAAQGACNVALLLDDPARIPTLFSPFTQPGE
jgi:hypothetical protein